MHELVWIKLNETKCTVKQWNLFANTFCRSDCEVFLMYRVIAVFNSVNVRGQSRYTADFAPPLHRLKSGGVRSGDRGDHKFLEMTCSPKISIRRFIEVSSFERTTVSKNWFKQLNTLPVLHLHLHLHFNRCLTAEYSEMSHNNSPLQRQLRYWQPNLRTVA